MTTFEHRVGDRVFHFICEQEATTVEASMALCHFMKYLAQIEDAAQAERQKEQHCEANVEDVCL